MNNAYLKFVATLTLSTLPVVCGAPALAGDRDWTHSYNASGQVLTADGPRTDVSDITTYTYDASGNRITITNALGHTTRLGDYDGRGRPGLVTDANGVQTLLSYNERGWILSSTVRGGAAADATTRYTYDDEGQLLSTTLPHGVVWSNTYDAAHRLVVSSNNRGERIEYQLDAAGNSLTETTRAGDGTIVRSLANAYDELNRLIRITGAAGQETLFFYDRNGNRRATTDGNLNNTLQDHDALDRMVATTASHNHNVAYQHDARDNLVRVTDPQGLATAYGHDGLDNLLQLSSPDTGITHYSYDAAGNQLSSTDAKGVTASYSYDALNRLLGISYPDTALNISYGYDAGAFGKGRLTSVTDASGTTLLSYDARGNVVYQGLETAQQDIDLGYAYDAADQLLQIVYPSGRVVDYSRGADGRITGATTTTAAAAQVLASNVDYLPFGPMNRLDYGNGIRYNGEFDLDYRVARMSHAAVRDTAYAYDGADNITGISNNLNSNASQLFGYDGLNRLAGADGAYGTINYTYDANGNRLSYTDSSGGDSYTYDATSHRLLSTADWDYQYDSNGNRTARITRADASGDGTLYRYDENNRLVEVIERQTVTTGKGGGATTEQIDTSLATYTYNASGQRARKISAGGTVYYIYGRDGMLLAEVNDAGISLREYIYLNGQPLAVAASTVTTFPAATGPETILDDGDAGTSATGNWDHIRKKGAYNDYYGRSADTGSVYRWTPGGLHAADYEVYAWWPKTNKNNKTAEYTVVHNGQSNSTIQDQSTLGKQWVLLGTYPFSGSGDEYIEISDLGGKTAADGIRLVELLPPPPPEVTTAVYYIHNDHLGTPQVLTDQSQTVAWSASYKPFGEVSIGTSTVVNNLRFPGQYFDEESGLYYNDYRDYDPSMGRYIQSDPAGLDGGLNTFSYVESNPISYFDPNGLFKVQSHRQPGGSFTYTVDFAPNKFVGLVNEYQPTSPLKWFNRANRAREVLAPGSVNGPVGISDVKGFSNKSECLSYESALEGAFNNFGYRSGLFFGTPLTSSQLDNVLNSFRNILPESVERLYQLDTLISRANGRAISTAGGGQ